MAIAYDEGVTAIGRDGTLVSGKYQVERRIGHGATAEVYRAQNLLTGRVVALKFLDAHLAQEKVALHRFLREARAAARVKHPNVVDILDVGQAEDNVPYIVQDYLEGAELREHVASKGGHLTTRKALAILRPIAEALAVAHELGVVHRDVTPGNIFIAIEQGKAVPKLLDFGISRISTFDATPSMSGALVGTPAYMAPEQLHAPEKIGPTTDVWAFGVVLFELVTGRRPFMANNIAGIYIAITKATPPRLDTLAADAPPSLCDLVARCLERDPDLRLPNGKALIRALDSPKLVDEVAQWGRL